MIIQSAERETHKSFNSVHNGNKNVLSYEKELTERFFKIRVYFSLIFQGLNKGSMERSSLVPGARGGFGQRNRV